MQLTTETERQNIENKCGYMYIIYTHIFKFNCSIPLKLRSIYKFDKVAIRTEELNEQININTKEAIKPNCILVYV